MPVSITGTVEFSTQDFIRPAPPRGISTSTAPFILISSFALSLEVSVTRQMQFSSSPAFFNAPRRALTMAFEEFIASLPPLRIQAFPDLIHRAAASEVTFGLAS